MAKYNLKNEVQTSSLKGSNPLDPLHGSPIQSVISDLTGTLDSGSELTL